MSAELVAVVVFDELLFKPGGQVHRWMTLLCTHFQAHAIAEAPKRSGELKAGIASHAEPFGVKQMRGTIESNAPHSLYVLKGTTGPIVSRKMRDNPEGAYVTLWGSIDPKTKKFTRRRIKGVQRKPYQVRQQGYWLAVGKERLYPPITPRGSVAGQDANNFLFRAWRLTARTHPSIRGISPTASITDF